MHLDVWKKSTIYSHIVTKHRTKMIKPLMGIIHGICLVTYDFDKCIIWIIYRK